MQVLVLGGSDRLKPPPSRAEPIGSDRKPRKEPSEAVSRRGVEPRERRRVDCGQGLVGESACRADADPAGNFASQVGRIELSRRTAVMPGYRPKQRKSLACASPFYEQRINILLQSSAEECVAGIVVEAGRRLRERPE